MVRVVAAVLSAALVAVCAIAKSVFLTAEAPDYNNQVVGHLLATIDSVRGKGDAYAVFDWDNTCMFGDISYTAVSYQVDHLNFRLSPKSFHAIFSLGYKANQRDTCLPHGINSVIGDDVDGTSVTLATALAAIVKDYQVLYNAYIAPTFHLVATATVSPVPLAEIKRSPEFANFRAKLAFFLFGIEALVSDNDHDDCAMTIGATLFPQLLIGMTKDEIQTLIRASIRWNLGQALKTYTYTSTGDLQVQGSFTKGLRVFSGQMSTMRALRAAGVHVYIISASPQLFAAEAGHLFGLGYMVPKDNVYGVRFQFDAAGRFTGKLVEKYPITWGPGKATVVKSILMPRHHGAPPIYASGDSDGDCEMLDTVRDGVIDTNNRLMGNASCIHRFYVKACQYFGTTEPRTHNAYLLQGQDQVIGTWITSGFSTKDGITYESGVTSYDQCAQYQLLNL